MGGKGTEFANAFDRGVLSDFNDDHSTVDMFVVNVLAFLSGPNPDQIDRLFRQSKLYRAMWDEQRGVDTYRDLTIGNVLRNEAGAGPSIGRPATRRVSLIRGVFRLLKGFRRKNEKCENAEAPRFPVEVFPPL